jgi:hypothetical protein
MMSSNMEEGLICGFLRLTATPNLFIQAKGTTVPCLPEGEGQGGMISTMLEAPVVLAGSVKLRTTVNFNCLSVTVVLHHTPPLKPQQLRRVGALVNPCRLSNFNPFLCMQVAVLPRCAVKGCAGREPAERAPTQRSWAVIVR